MLKVKSSDTYRSNFNNEYVVHTKMHLITFYKGKSLRRRKVRTKPKLEKFLLKVSDSNEIGILQQGSIYSGSVMKLVSRNKISPHVKVSGLAGLV